MDGRLETVDDRPALRFERHLAHPLERVWSAISAPAELGRWFPGTPDWTPAVGESFEAGGESGEVVEVDAPHVLAWTFGTDRFRFELRAEGEGCVLTFTHVFEGRELGAQHATGWEIYFSRLDAHLAGGLLSEEEAHRAPWIAALHERYAESFGLDPAVGRAMFGQGQETRHG